MRVGLDYWTAPTHAPGVGRYVRELVRALAHRADAPALALLEVGPGPRRVPAQELGLEHAPPGWTRLSADVPRGALAALGGLGLGADRLLGGVDLFHAVDDALPPLARAPRVLARSELPPQGTRTRTPEALVVFCQSARIPFAQAWNVDPAHVHVVPVGCDHWLRASGVRDVREGPARLVVLGRVDERRGVRALLEACALLHAGGSELELTWCGRAGDAVELLHGALERDSTRLRWRPDASEHELAVRVAEADLVVHLAEQEWTPVTALEALAAGAALVASRLPALVEAVGDAAAWVDGAPQGLDARALADALALALEGARDPAARAARRAHAAPFTWDRHAALTIDAWTRILASR